MHIDWWTLALQAINVLILVWILARFFYRPVAAIIEQRRAQAAKLIADAAAARATVEAEKAEVAATRAGFSAEREKLLAGARKDAEAGRDAMLKDASDDVARLKSENEALLARERKAMEEAVMERAGALAVDIARKLLEKLPPATAADAFIDGLCGEVAALPPSSRELLRAAAATNGLIITTAAPLNESQREHCRRAIEQVLGAEAKCTFRTDPALIAGIEVRSDAIIVKNNWQDGLALILKQLRNDDRQQQRA